MEELKMLVQMVADLPNAALWVIAALFAYKVCVVGSIYGVLRLAIDRLHSWAIARKSREVEYKEFRPMLDGVCIQAETDRLIAQIHRLRGKGVSIESKYIHSQGVDWLRLAIDAKEEADREQAAKKSA